MNNQTKYTRLCAMFFVLFFSSVAIAGTPKVEVCHVPASAEDTSHTINVSERALPAHLAHGDYEGPCVEDGFCPCFTPTELADLGGGNDSGSCTEANGQTLIIFANGNQACTGLGCIGSGLACLTYDGELSSIEGISQSDSDACATVMDDLSSCP